MPPGIRVSCHTCVSTQLSGRVRSARDQTSERTAAADQAADSARLVSDEEAHDSQQHLVVERGEGDRVAKAQQLGKREAEAHTKG